MSTLIYARRQQSLKFKTLILLNVFLTFLTFISTHFINIYINLGRLLIKYKYQRLKITKL